MPHIRAVIFDSDGTLIDGFAVIVGAYAHVAALHGYPAPTIDEVREQLSMARPLHEIYQTFFPGEDVGQLVKENGEYLSANIMPGFEGLKELLSTLSDRGLLMGVITGGNHKIHDLFQYHGIGGYFASIAHSDRTTRAKPDPEGVQLVMEECGVLPAETVVVGDSPNDIFAGKNAGVKYTIGITHGHGSRRALQASDPDFTVNSLGELQGLLLELV